MQRVNWQILLTQVIYIFVVTDIDMALPTQRVFIQTAMKSFGAVLAMIHLQAVVTAEVLRYFLVDPAMIPTV